MPLLRGRLVANSAASSTVKQAIISKAVKRRVGKVEGVAR